MSSPAALSEEDVDRLARLHLAELPTSIVSRLGLASVKSFYRYCVKSPNESVLVERDRVGAIVAAAVVTLDNATLERRLLTKTRASLDLLLSPKIVFSILKSRSHTKMPRGAELVMLFTDPSHRGQGLASKLLERCREVVRKDGQRTMFVRTFTDPASVAYRFYDQRGLKLQSIAVVSGAQTAIFALKV